MEMQLLLHKFYVILALFCLSMTTIAGTAKRAKLIDLSWSNPTVEFLLKNVREMEKTSPLNGVIIRVGAVGEKNGAPWKATSENAFGKTPFKYEWFKDQVALLKSVEFKKFTDNFLYCVVSPGDQAWFSDSDWGNLCNNYAIMAKIAKEGGLKGIFFDSEQYSRVFWDAGTIADKSIPYSELTKLAARRGREWGNAIFSEYPDIVLFMALFITHEESSDLRSYFFRGVLEAMPAEATIIDAQEAAGYGMRNPQDLDRMAVTFYHDIPSRLPQHLREKFYRQVRFSSAFYLDAYSGESVKYTNDMLPDIENTKSRVDFLRRNLATVLERIAPDSYVMFYGERGAWWHGSPHKHAQKTWEEKMPGITKAVEGAVSPEKFKVGRELLGVAANKPDFWQTKYSHGKQTGAFKAQGVSAGSFNCVYLTQGNRWILLRCDAKNLSSEGICTLGVSFKDTKNNWNYHEYNRAVPFVKSNDWTHLSVPFYIPEGVVKVAVVAGMYHFKPDEEAEFRNLQLFEY